MIDAELKEIKDWVQERYLTYYGDDTEDDNAIVLGNLQALIAEVERLHAVVKELQIALAAYNEEIAIFYRDATFEGKS